MSFDLGRTMVSDLILNTLMKFIKYLGLIRVLWIFLCQTMAPKKMNF